MSTHFESLGQGLYRFSDLVNVYVIVRNSLAIAIELGRGRVLDHLDEIGAERLEWVLHTHHHRDLCLGDKYAASRGAQIAVPAGEADLFANAEDHWRQWQIYVNYNLRNRYDAPRENVPVSRQLAAGETFSWQGLDIQALPTPGHTDASLSYLADIEGKRFCFCGDAITAPGKIPTIHDLHWGYMPPGSGLPVLADSLQNILDREPDVLLPARGHPIADPPDAISPLREKLRNLEHHLKPNHAGRKKPGLHRVAEHIWFLGCTSYCILLDNGHALIWDYGYVPREAIDTLRRDHGLKCVDTVAVSHYHDDHVARIPELVHTVCRNQSPRPEVWVFENQAEIYTDPTRFNIPCLWPTPIPYDRVITQDEMIHWQGVPLQFFHMPGQTEWHCGMIADLDGRRYAFTGDNLWKPGDPDRSPNGPIIWRNQQFLNGGTLKGFRKLHSLAPDVILPAHTDPVDPTTPEYIDAIVSWAEQLKPLMEDLIDQPEPEFGCDCFWVYFHPYRRIIDPDTGAIHAQISIHNHHRHEASLSLKPVLPTGWHCRPEAVETTIPPQTRAAFPFEILPADLAPDCRYILAADVVLDGVDHGEKAEMIVDTNS